MLSGCRRQLGRQGLGNRRNRRGRLPHNRGVHRDLRHGLFEDRLRVHDRALLQIKDGGRIAVDGEPGVILHDELLVLAVGRVRITLLPNTCHTVPLLTVMVRTVTGVMVAVTVAVSLSSPTVPRSVSLAGPCKPHGAHLRG